MKGRRKGCAVHEEGQGHEESRGPLAGMVATRTLAAIAAFAAVVVPCAAVAPSVMAALRGLYFGTGGNTSWIDTKGWDTLETNSPSDPCDRSDRWFGISCGGGDDDDPYLVALDVSK